MMTLKEKTLIVWATLAALCVIGIFAVALVNAEVLAAVGIALTAVLTFFATRIAGLFPTKKDP